MFFCLNLNGGIYYEVVSTDWKIIVILSANRKARVYVSKTFQFFRWYRIPYQINLVSKKYRISYRRNLVSEKYRIWFCSDFGYHHTLHKASLLDIVCSPMDAYIYARFICFLSKIELRRGSVFLLSWRNNKTK